MCFCFVSPQDPALWAGAGDRKKGRKILSLNVKVYKIFYVFAEVSSNLSCFR